MSGFFEYIRKNIMFVMLLSVLIICCLVFGGYMIAQNINSRPVANPSTVEEDPKGEAQISSFEGSYGHDAAVHLSWTIQRGDLELLSVKLYQGDRQIGGEMKDLSSFAMAQSLYQFPSGSCTFTLKAEFADDVVISKDVNVFISYVMGINMTTEKVENGILLKLSYAYDEDHPVDVPRIKFINGGSYPFTITYQETTKTKNGLLIRAETIFKLNTDALAEGSYPVTIRWIFEGTNISKDFDIVIQK